jgi:uncharacterized lipoprotein YmbA
MSIYFLRTGLYLVILLVWMTLPGCIGSKVPATRFYILNPMDADIRLLDERETKEELSIEVASIRLPQYLERPQIVTRSSKNRLELAEFHQWGGNLRKNMIRVLAKNLSQLLATSKIAISPHHPPSPPDFRIALEIMKFERDSDGKVKLSGQWRLTGGKTGKALAARISDLASPAIENDKDLESTVHAMSALMGELSRIIGLEILKNVPMIR